MESQKVLDFEVEAVPRVAGLMAAPAEPTLFDESRRAGPAGAIKTCKTV